MFPIDFYLGSKLGLWLAENASFHPMDNFITKDHEILEVLRSRNLIRTENSFAKRAFSVHWQEKIESECISQYEYFLNIHPGYLPFGRGTYPIFWAVYLNQKAGVTVHQITEKIDSGPILSREEVFFEDFENSGQVWRRVFNKEKEILLESILILRNQDNLNLKEITNEKIGINRKKSEFQKLLSNPNLGQLSENEITRLILAVTHDEYDLPVWLKNMRVTKISTKSHF